LIAAALSRLGRLGALVALGGVSLAACTHSPLTVQHAIVPGGIVGPLPAGLPTHLAIGLAAGFGQNGLDGWVPESKIPFDYTYQYLAGGVDNPGQGWQTWMPHATFPTEYATVATSEGHIPVLDYYMLLQSGGPCANCEEDQKDLDHLNDPSLMAAYYEDFETLMKRLGSRTWGGVKGFGGTVIVHVEPDLSAHAEEAVLDPSRWCFGLCDGQGNNPALLHASVASSGLPALAGLPNNYVGFNLALLQIRDLFAPNVLMAYHLSNWSTGTDIASNTDRSIDTTRIGSEAGRFAAEAGVATIRPGVSTYDLVFNDVSDRDSEVSGIWWDVTNRRDPNFARWETFLGSAESQFKRPVFVWQVPLGNQWFRTENGSTGHTRDNRIEYFFSHQAELVHAGVAAVLFGNGISNSTSNYPLVDDAPFNPQSVCSTEDGVTACSTHLAVWSDDDGGYLRTQAALYYRHPLPLVWAPNGA
jgi:hypothetical protein